MDDTPDNTEIANPLETSQPRPQSAEEDRSLEEVIAQSSTDLLHTFAASIHQGAMTEANQTEAFRQEFKRRLIRAVVGTYVWSTARLLHETETHESRLASGVQEVLSAEREQGRSSPTMFGTSVWWVLSTIASADELPDKIDFVRSWRG